MKRILMSVSCAALAVCGVNLAHDTSAQPRSRDQSASHTRTPVLLSSFAEIYASDTPADWATSADHIAEVTILGETAGAKEAGWINRSVTVRVDKARWSRPGSPPLPETFDMKTWGWVASTDGPREVAVPDSSRIEPGHRYIMALVLLEPRCNADDGLAVEGGWATIGTKGVIPFDGGDVGRGEVEGSPNAAIEGESGTVADIAETAATPDDIVERVDAADPTERPVQPGVREGC